MTKSATKPIRTFSGIMAAKRPTTASRDICLDPALVDTYDEARRAKEKARSVLADAYGPDTAPEQRALAEADEHLKAAEKALRDGIVTFRFRALSGAAYEALMKAHPATGEQTAEARSAGRPVPNWNPDSFPLALLAASCVEPAVTTLEVAELWKGEAWSHAERIELFSGALEANTSRPVPTL